jgi:hypothetical protein
MTPEPTFVSKRCVHFLVEGPLGSDATIVQANQFPSLGDLREFMDFVRKQRIHLVDIKGEEDEIHANCGGKVEGECEPGGVHTVRP